MTLQDEEPSTVNIDFASLKELTTMLYDCRHLAQMGEKRYVVESFYSEDE